MRPLLLFAVAACAAGAMLWACSGPGSEKARTESPSASPPGRDRQASLDTRGLPPKVDDIAATGSEPEFTYCCGDARYKLEIECEAGLMRCYEYRVDGWHYTYGRHCKEHLGQICYMTGCDDKCQ